jgi:hypothetical protein
LHVDAVIFDARWERGLFERWAEEVLSVANVELPAVPRASDDAAFEPAFAQGTALVWADAVEGIVGAIYIVDRHYAVAGDPF